ncbi:hypothetical protein [Desulfovibrio sp. SGI.169]|uniref:hypothetical protein n=1 Tax=Desulfovibrio sp. SGI.169 TaxID=3420561 RepID=UPI003D09514B
MKKCHIHVLWLLVLLCPAFCAAGSLDGMGADDGWVTMPAGARPAYMGIHGGTVPVSLLVSDDGSSLLTFVGRTGNDFLEVLRRTDVRMPSLLNATATRNSGGSHSSGGGTRLMAGSAASSMPVIYLTGEGFARAAPSPTQLQPFGLSDKPLSIEGQVAKPAHLSPVKRYRLFFQPQYLQPRRAPN